MIGTILIACEKSATVRDAFAARGWDAWSCDLQPAPGQHFQQDVTQILSRHWDMCIAHPPCTFLAFSGHRWLRSELGRNDKFVEAVKFFHMFMQCSIKHVCIENPMQHWQAKEFIPKHTQVIQPWQFGHEAQKTTWLWLKNLPPLRPTNIVDKGEFRTFASGKKMAEWMADAWNMSDEDRQNLRSKTFPGIAEAMAEQWTEYFLSTK